VPHRASGTSAEGRTVNRNLCLSVMKFIILLSGGCYMLCDLVVISIDKDLEEVEEPQCYSTLYYTLCCTLVQMCSFHCRGHV